MTVRTTGGLVSVIVPYAGPLDPVRRCISALMRHTRRPWELIAVTRGGREMSAYLAGLRDAAPVRIEVVAEPELRSTRAAWLRGLREARGDLVAFLRGRVVVTDAWLDQLVALANSDRAIGMVAPMSDSAPPPQWVEWTEGDDLDVFAARWRTEWRGRWFTAERLNGPCILLKRGVLEAVTAQRKLRPTDLRPARLSQRVQGAGFRLAVAKDLFIHHESAARVPSAAAPSPGRRRRCRISLTMIVRNEEENLPACLASAADLFDEIVIVDTGSTDRTVEIARSFGARVFDFVWVDDFAATRNAALARATGDYAFWLDADDRLEPPNRERLRALFDELRASDSAYVVRCSCDADPKGGGATVVDHIRLFPVREDVRWSYRVHEQVMPALRRAGVPVRWTDVVVRHVGYNDPEVRQRKLARDHAILESESHERPDDPFVLFNLGQVAMELGDARGALEYLRGSLARSAPADSITRKLHALISRAHQVLGKPREALDACATGLAVDPDDAELLFRKGVLHRLQGEAAEAGACWRRILTLRRPERFASVDEGIYGHVTRRNLAVLAEEQGDRAEAALHWSSVLAERPGDPEATRAMARLGRPPVPAGSPAP